MMDRAELREAMQVPDDDTGGYLVPSEQIVSLAVHLGMPRLSDRMRWDDRVYVEIGDKPHWWQWLFHNYSTNKIASFLVWRWPKFLSVVVAYGECCRGHQEETEYRVQKAYEFLYSLTEKDGAITQKAIIGNFAEYRYCIMKVASDDDYQAPLD